MLERDDGIASARTFEPALIDQESRRIVGRAFEHRTAAWVVRRAFFSTLRKLDRTSRDLGESTFDVAERELAMAIQVSAQIRDSTLSEKALERARTEGVTARLRQDAHQAVDIAADLGSILYTSGLDFLERFADDRRPPLSSDKG